jgi:hypothetical protein
MLDRVLNRRAVPLSRVTPVVLPDEFLVAAVADGRWRAGRRHAESIPSAAMPPLVHDTPRRLVEGCRRLRAHPPCHIRLVVNGPRDGRDRSPRDDLLQEDDGSPVGAQRPDVKPQVDFRKVTMPWNRYAEYPRVEKTKPDEANQGVAAPDVQLGPCRHERRDELRIDPEVEHRQEPPLGGEERALHRIASASLRGAQPCLRAGRQPEGTIKIDSCRSMKRGCR